MQTLSYLQLMEWQQKGQDFILIDVREPFEHEHFNIGGRNIPLGELMNFISEIPTDKSVIFYCAKGIRSVIAIQKLEQKGFNNLVNLSNGVSSLTP
jgi:adenylyltransferase/sulfurtransferase